MYCRYYTCTCIVHHLSCSCMPQHSKLRVPRLVDEASLHTNSHGTKPTTKQQRADVHNYTCIIHVYMYNVFLYNVHVSS